MPTLPLDCAFRARWFALLLFSGAAIAQAEPAWMPLREFTLDLAAHWEPLTDTTYGFEKEPLVADLAPAAARAPYGAEAFRPFLPPAEVAVGTSWRVDAAAVLPFLRQLHVGARIGLHHDGGSGFSADGAWACLRVLDDRNAEIMLRAHAEFLLAGDGTRMTSSWFTPAQFRGRMRIDRRTGQVIGFELAVPTSRANVDINLELTADIGCVPRLQLCGGTFPEPAAGAAQITDREAERILERRFYPFAELEWLELPAAAAAARTSGRPLHIVALFGSLPDESC